MWNDPNVWHGIWKKILGDEGKKEEKETFFLFTVVKIAKKKFSSYTLLVPIL